MSQAERLRIELRAGPDGALEERARQLIIERTPATINFMMCDQTWEHGPIRHVAGASDSKGRKRII
jgi:hypothetical protein